jgi:hypothetical protein
VRTGCNFRRIIRRRDDFERRNDHNRDYSRFTSRFEEAAVAETKSAEWRTL